ncbi:tropomyosin [Gongronella butleri]|nr:tropomyosin [Gongronella butleri]
MEKFKEKLQLMRAQVEEAEAKNKTLEDRIAEMTTDKINHEHEIVSLNNKVNFLEEQLEKAEKKMEMLQSAEAKGDDISKENDAAQRRIMLLEQELEQSEKSLKEMTANFREADVKAEHFERTAKHLEAQGEKYEEKILSMEEENSKLRKELEEIQSALDNL